MSAPTVGGHGSNGVGVGSLSPSTTSSPLQAQHRGGSGGGRGASIGGHGFFIFLKDVCRGSHVALSEAFASSPSVRHKTFDKEFFAVYRLAVWALLRVTLGKHFAEGF